MPPYPRGQLKLNPSFERNSNAGWPVFVLCRALCALVQVAGAPRCRVRWHGFRQKRCKIEKVLEKEGHD
eukprot:scaffold78806_cov35-Tisochrysis_lutea.AAC.2